MPSLPRIAAVLATAGSVLVLGVFALFIGSPVSVPLSDDTPESLAFADESDTEIQLGTPERRASIPDESNSAAETLRANESESPSETSGSGSTTTTIGDSNPFRFPTTVTTAPPDITLPNQVVALPTTTSSPTTAPPPTTPLPTTPPTTSQTSTSGSTPAPTTSRPSTTATEPDQPKLVFQENFDTFSPSRWVQEHSTYGDRNNELQCYTPQQVAVVNGALTLTAERRTETCPNGSIRDVTSGMVRSSEVTFSPGQSIEWRVKLTPNDPANQAGLWPAFWSSGFGGGAWPLGGEWDGFEVMTARNPKGSVFGIHYAQPDGTHGKTSTEVVSATNFSDSLHTFRFDYGSDGVLVWYMDGTAVQRVTRAPTRQTWPAPFDQTMTELKINLALGGTPGALDVRALPATYQVDWIRIYDLPS